VEPPDPRTTALLLVDVQNDYWTPPREPRPSFAATVAGLLALAREAGWLVVHVQHARRPGSGKGGFVPGTHGFEVHDAAAPRDGEPRVVKHAPSAFFETGLDDLLRGHGIDTVVVAGMQTQKCCDTTARSASARGYRCFFVRDAVETFDLTGPDGEVVGRDEIARVTFATLANGFATVLPLAELAALAYAGGEGTSHSGGVTPSFAE
jgi:nicotinamidase-related amidase